MTPLDLRDIPKQERLREQFRPSYKKTAPTTACPCCCPGLKKRVGGWERGTCGDLVAMRCNNCGFIRASKPRSTHRHRGLTIGQERGVSAFHARLERWKGSDYTVTQEAPGEPWCDGSVPVSFRWEIKDRRGLLPVMSDGSVSVVFGIKGGARIYYYQSGLSTDKAHDAKMAGFLAEFAGAQLKLN